ncbi:MAG: hypothetical protein ACRC6N_04840, partial [Plesiomonas sp.]|uniref:hypothetical protein n=1 Tax=Plesiomonas sp. TaxID=2486279 RepID=UPI003F2B0C55
KRLGQRLNVLQLEPLDPVPIFAVMLVLDVVWGTTVVKGVALLSHSSVVVVSMNTLLLAAEDIVSMVS